MAEKQRFPQIPSTVWWGVRSLLQKTPRVIIDERTLGVQLGVQEAAARQYIVELKNVGILDNDCRATELAVKWRLDDSYSDAAEELVRENYPEGLIQLAPPDEGDRQKIVTWFEREGLGKGAAGNKAATYLLLGSSLPSDSPSKVNGKSAVPKAAPKKSTATPISLVKQPNKRNKGDERFERPPGKAIPLNVNVQIHISADAGVDQINAIFAAMKRYLGDGIDV